MIKIDVISGFLGAGKTTLIKKLFEGAFKDEKVVLIENEFGEIGIDGSFLKESGINIKEINAGCICCSLVGDFATSLKEVIDQYSPTRIVIEPSGVGKLSDIVNAINDVDADLKLNILATVVDGTKAKVYAKNFGEFFINQVETANTIVVSKLDKASVDKANTAIEICKGYNENASIITTPITQLTSEKLLEILEEGIHLKNDILDELMEERHHVPHKHHHHEHHHEEGCCCGEHHHEHHHEEGCCCGEHHHEHHHEEGHCCCVEHHHEHHHEEGCCCGEHHHEHHHEEGCCCEDHHHEHHHEEGCCCGEHHHEHHHEEGCCCGGHHHHHHDADDVFVNFGIETIEVVTKEELEKFLTEITKEEYGIVIRSKGILKSTNDEWLYYDYVAGDFEIRKGNPDYASRLVVIGSEIDEAKIKEVFKNRGAL